MTVADLALVAALAAVALLVIMMTAVFAGLLAASAFCVLLS
jgi:hypothetical protein